MAGTPLRILQIYPKGDFFPGAAIQLWELARGLADRGHRVVIATPPSEVWAARCAEAGLTHTAIAMRRAIQKCPYSCTATSTPIATRKASA